MARPFIEHPYQRLQWMVRKIAQHDVDIKRLWRLHRREIHTGVGLLGTSEQAPGNDPGGGIPPGQACCETYCYNLCPDPLVATFHFTLICPPVAHPSGIQDLLNDVLVLGFHQLSGVVGGSPPNCETWVFQSVREMNISPAVVINESGVPLTVETVRLTTRFTLANEGCFLSMIVLYNYNLGAASQYQTVILTAEHIGDWRLTFCRQNYIACTEPWSEQVCFSLVRAT